MSPPPEPSSTSSLARVGLGLTGVAHAGLAIAWMSAMAGGFDAFHRMSLSNRWVPGGLVVMGAVALLGVLVERPRATRHGVVAMCGLWVGIGAAVLALLSGRVSLLGLVPLVLGAAAAQLIRMPSQTRRSLALVPGIIAGAAVVWAQRSAEPGTRPSGGSIAPVTGAACQWEGTVDFAMARSVRLRVNPLLAFQSVSPDRSWTVLAPGDSWRGRMPRCMALQDDGEELRARFEAEGEASLVVRSAREPSSLTLETVTRLPAAVYSHLNHFFAAQIEGTPGLRITLSPCPTHALEPLSRQGRGQFAFLDAAGEFVIVRAASAEKGPFEELCRVALPPEQSIDVVIHDENRPVGRIRLMDWTAQADLGPSPTAGWDVAANAIELWRISPTSVYLSVSLSATSIGRGWHSVGHGPGTYRNRVELSSLP